MAKTRYGDALTSVVYAILLLFFFQLIADFVEAIYAFGLAGTDIPPEIVSLLFLFSPFLLFLFRRELPRILLIIAGELMLLSRLVEVALDTKGRMLVSGLGIFCFFLILPGLLWLNSRWEKRSELTTMGGGLILATMFSIFFRSLNSGLDWSTVGVGQIIGLVLALITGILLPGVIGARPEKADESSAGGPSGQGSGKQGRTIILSLGIVAVLSLLYFSISSPTVISRWTEADYLLVVSAISVVLALFGWLIWTRPSFLTGLTRSRLLIWNALFVLALTLMQLFHQVSFPIKESAYPLAAPSNAAWRHVPLAFVLLLFPVLFVDFILLLEAYKAFRPTPRALARGFGVASLFLLIMVLAHVFTTTYDYIPVVGPLFRDKFWLVYLLLGVVLLLAMIAVDKRVYGRRLKETATNAGRVNSWLVVAFGFAAILGTLVTTARPVSQPADNRSLKLLTYNIQQGYSLDGQRNYDGQLELIRDTDPDLIGLQETDNARISGGNNDVVRYMADKLDMYSYYGPKTVVGTFGIALLSKVPIESPRTHYLYSEGEQVAVIEAQISSGSRTFNVFVIHHGNCGDGPQWQQPEFLQLVNGKENVLVMGDHNFRPVARPSAECSRDDHELYGQTVSILDDVVPVNEKGDRIDHIFVSPDLQYRDSRYIDSSASDHPALTTIIEW